MICLCPDNLQDMSDMCEKCQTNYDSWLSSSYLMSMSTNTPKMKKVVEINIPILASNNSQVGIYNRRFNTRAEAKQKIFVLEEEGFRFKDPFNEMYWSIVEVIDEDQLQ